MPRVIFWIIEVGCCLYRLRLLILFDQRRHLHDSQTNFMMFISKKYPVLIYTTISSQPVRLLSLTAAQPKHLKSAFADMKYILTNNYLKIFSNSFKEEIPIHTFFHVFNLILLTNYAILSVHPHKYFFIIHRAHVRSSVSWDCLQDPGELVIQFET